MINPDDGGGNGDANLNCKARNILKTKTIDELIDMLSNSVGVGDPLDDEEILAYYKK